MKTPKEESDRIVNRILLIRKITLLNRIFATAIGLLLLAEAIYSLVQNPFAYIVSPTLNLYLGHTRILLVILPLFIYYTWKYEPYYAPLYILFLYCLHEFVFNSFFVAYYHVFNSDPRGILFIPFAIAFVYSIVTKRFHYDGLVRVALIIFLGLMALWIVIGFPVTSNYTLPESQNVINSMKLLPNIFEFTYNLSFTFLFWASFRFKHNLGHTI